MTPAELLTLAHEIRAVNMANGWNTTQESDWGTKYKVPAILALIHSEITEFWAERDGHIEETEELADVQIRVLDLMGAAPESSFVNAFEAQEISQFSRGLISGSSRDGFTCEMHDTVTTALECYRVRKEAWPADFLFPLARLFLMINVRSGEAMMGDAIQAKLAKNRNRGYRHGGKRV